MPGRPRAPSTAGRFVVPVAVLGAEFLALSVLVDFPVTGPAIRVVEALRLAVPVIAGAAVGGWLLARRAPLVVPADRLDALPWRPVPALAMQVLAFAATALWSHRILHFGAPPLELRSLLLWAGGVATCVLLAFASAAPLRWIVRVALARWRLAMLAVAVGLLAWWTAARLESTWGLLSGATLRAVAWLLDRVTSDATVDIAEQVVGAGGFEVVIAPVCSGVNGIGLVVVFQATWMFASRSGLRFPRALLLFPLGAATALLANAARITALVLIGAAGHERLAVGGFHSKLGWVLFVAIALGTIVVAERIPWLRRDPRSESAADGVPAAAAAYVAPLVAALAVALVTSLWADGSFDAAYGARAGAGALALALVRRSLPPARLSISPVAVGIAAAVAVPWIGLGGAAGGDALSGALTALSPAARWGWIATRLLGSCLVLPVVEELAFRGFLLPALMSKEFERVPPRAWTWPAVLLSSAAFGALHANWLLGTAAGCAFAVARLLRGRLADAIAAHALCNAAVAAAVLLGGRWDLWS